MYLTVVARLHVPRLIAAGTGRGASLRGSATLQAVTDSLPGHATITIHLCLDDDDVHMTLTVKPMIPAHSVALLLEKTAHEILAGRLDSITLGT